MYGVIVVPTTATMRSRLAGARSSDGVTSARPTAPQSGSASTADTMYARNTTMTARNTRSTVR